MGPKRLKTRQTTLQHSKNLEFNNLSRHYGIRHKNGQIWVLWAELLIKHLTTLMHGQVPIRAWILHTYDITERLMYDVNSTIVTKCLWAGTIHREMDLIRYAVEILIEFMYLPIFLMSFKLNYL